MFLSYFALAQQVFSDGQKEAIMISLYFKSTVAVISIIWPFLSVSYAARQEALIHAAAHFRRPQS